MYSVQVNTPDGWRILDSLADRHNAEWLAMRIVRLTHSLCRVCDEGYNIPVDQMPVLSRHYRHAESSFPSRPDFRWQQQGF